MYKEFLLKVLQSPHLSEKASITTDRYNTVVFRVAKSANKLDIKLAIQSLFGVKVLNVCTLVMKGKVKRYKKFMGRRSDWKKAYVSLKKGEKLDIIGSMSS